MSNSDKLAEWVLENGPATEETIKARLGSLTPLEIHTAIKNARSRRLIHPASFVVVGKARRAVWAYGAVAHEGAVVAVRGEYGIGRVNSVWQLAGSLNAPG